MLPLEVLEKAQAEMLDYEGSGQSVTEMSHRSKVFDKIIKDAEKLFREILNVPDNYKVLFLQGGASTQFAAIPLNFMNKNGKADYIVTGVWAKKAWQEAQKYGNARKVASSEDKVFSYIPNVAREDFDPEADYVYMCMNNTIYGTKYPYIPDTGDIPLIADVSSCFLSEPLDVSKFAMIYGGAQKNIAPAGLVVAAIREDMLGHARDITCYTIYMCKLVLEWIKKMGGLEGIKANNVKKAKILYDFLDQSKMFRNTVNPEDRSLMNVTFVTGNDELDAKCVKEAAEQGLINLKGHRSIGGLRASIYNAMPIEGVQKLVQFLDAFEKANS